MSDREAAEFRRRRRGRNIALFVALAAVALLFYAMIIAKMLNGFDPFAH
jgi:ferric-dicitrate binding protein FerR (iron transport regulator)